MAKGKCTNNDLQNTTQKTKDRATQTPPEIWDINSGAPEWLAVPAPLEALVTNSVINHE